LAGGRKERGKLGVETVEGGEKRKMDDVSRIYDKLGARGGRRETTQTF